MADSFVPVTFVADELLTSTKMNLLAANQAGFHDGTALGDGIIVTRHVGNASITAAKLDAAAGQQAWQTLPLSNSWVPFGGVYVTPRYMKDSLGFVHVEGLIKSGTMGQVAATLPAGYRPAASHYWGSASSGGIGIADVAASGTITPQVGSSGSFMMDYIFKAEN